MIVLAAVFTALMSMNLVADEMIPQTKYWTKDIKNAQAGDMIYTRDAGLYCDFRYQIVVVDVGGNFSGAKKQNEGFYCIYIGFEREKRK